MLQHLADVRLLVRTHVMCVCTMYMGSFYRSSNQATCHSKICASHVADSWPSADLLHRRRAGHQYYHQCSVCPPSAHRFPARKSAATSPPPNRIMAAAREFVFLLLALLALVASVLVPTSQARVLKVNDLYLHKQGLSLSYIHVCTRDGLLLRCCVHHIPSLPCWHMLLMQDSSFCRVSKSDTW
jgi:hypothetical protein